MAHNADEVDMVRHNIAMSDTLRDALNVVARQRGVTAAGLTNALVWNMIEADDTPDGVLEAAEVHDSGDRLRPSPKAIRRLRLRV